MDLLVYLDEELIRNLNSVALNGYIDIRTFRKIKDRTIGGNVRLNERNSDGYDCRNQKDKIEGYKSKHDSYENHYQNADEKTLGFEGRDFDRNEQEIKKISTVFTLHNDLLNKMIESNYVKDFLNEEIDFSSIKEGDYIQIKGCVQPTSMPLYIDTLINSLNCYGDDCLNNMIDIEGLGNLNFNIIKSLLENLNKTIMANGTRDLIIENNDISIITSINEGSFLINHSNMFDLAHCNCKIFGKVMKIKEENEKCISLLRKSSQEEYFNNILNEINPYFKKLMDKGIILPEKPECNIEGKTLIILPISISI
ncbi:hypothetical protein [Clostridium sp.]|uniref:DUF6414 family protein n=1 Tax=Clostridium sp. TaxID=1506 RepID=UPI0026157485|nr:hypothetical protein [Clostridium sp.]